MPDLPESDLDSDTHQNPIPVISPGGPAVPAAPPPRQQIREVVTPPLHEFSAAVQQASPIGGLGPSAANPPPVAPATPKDPNLVPIREETIQIAPHPTTNRFPWAPVENPKIQIYGEAPQAPPPVELPAPPPVEPPQQPVPTATQPAAPPPPPPPPVPKPQPESLPEPKPLVIDHSPRPVLEPAAPVVPAPEPPVVIAPAPSEHPKQGKPMHIYSEYTREVWRVFRPSRLVQLILLLFFCTVIGLVVFFWVINGAPTNIQDMPILQPVLHAQ